MHFKHTKHLIALFALLGCLQTFASQAPASQFSNDTIKNEDKVLAECLDEDSKYYQSIKKIAQSALIPDLWKLVVEYCLPSKDAKTVDVNELQYYKTLRTPERRAYLPATSLLFTKAKDKLILEVPKGSFSKQPWIIWTIKDGFCNVGLNSNSQLPQVERSSFLAEIALESAMCSSNQEIKLASMHQAIGGMNPVVHSTINTESPDGILEATLRSYQNLHSNRIEEHTITLHINKVAWLKKLACQNSTAINQKTIIKPQPLKSRCGRAEFSKALQR